MSNYFFTTPEAQALIEAAGISQQIKDFAEQNKKQTYILCKPLSKEDSPYDYENACVLFISGMKPCFINTGDDADGFEEYIEEFFEDVSFLSEKFQYRKKIGRTRKWSGLFEKMEYYELEFETLHLDNPTDKRLSDLITSLVIGSINDISRINLEAESLLDIVKSKIILFDTDQTSFVFKTGQNKKYVIQGLAGSGKTELLLHKLKEIYSNEKNARIAFTCHNKILASSMRNRIPEFFNFMKVERQIEWENKIFCFSSWGSYKNSNSGMYRYICSEYGISFGTLQSGTFDYWCRKAIEEITSLHENGESKYIFDYVFIDESQDFDNSFIELCELVTEKKVFVAGDVFQNIFRPIDDDVRQADLLLKKCYRTDPRNLMFSHALGMGLYEEPVLRWLRENEWDACGYNYHERNGNAIISRDPLRRFEDIPDTFRATSITQIDNKNIARSIFSIVGSIMKKHDNVCPGDIAVLFLDKANYVYDVVPELAYIVHEELGWDTNISYESKTNDAGKFFISNINNAKGLEFPFVICFAQTLKRGTSFRNGLYTMMARSFLESHLVLGAAADQELIARLQNGLNYMYNHDGCMQLRIPSEEEIENQQAVILWDEKPSIESLVDTYCQQNEASPRLKAKLLQRMMEILDGEEYDTEYFNSLIAIEYNRYKKL